MDYHNACRTQFERTDCISRNIPIARPSHVTNAIENYVRHIHTTKGAYQHVPESFTLCEMSSRENRKEAKVKSLQTAGVGSVPTACGCVVTQQCSVSKAFLTVLLPYLHVFLRENAVLLLMPDFRFKCVKEPLHFDSSSSSVVLTRLSGPRSRPTTSQKIW
jgi:hypothetical protein